VSNSGKNDERALYKARPDRGVDASNVIIGMPPLPSSLTIGGGLLGE
jgi:hypothetical protein